MDRRPHLCREQKLPNTCRLLWPFRLLACCHPLVIFATSPLHEKQVNSSKAFKGLFWNSGIKMYLQLFELLDTYCVSEDECKWIFYILSTTLTRDELECSLHYRTAVNKSKSKENAEMKMKNGLVCSARFRTVSENASSWDCCSLCGNTLISGDHHILVKFGIFYSILVSVK